MKTKEIIVHIGGKSEIWTQTTLFCPICSKNTVYYLGAKCLCLSCHWEFYLPYCNYVGNDEEVKQRLIQLKK